MKYFRAAFILLFMHLNGYSQDKAPSPNSLAQSAFSSYKYEPAAKRKILSFKNKKPIARINPLNYLAAGALFVYQRLISEQIQANCMYEISCSNYTKLCIQEHGVSGFLAGIDQLNCCFAGVVYDYPDFMISPENKIRNQLSK
jgi:putative component of membrane protein insertase Oxa1/YidC/SpoIIIJ protein YidD